MQRVRLPVFTIYGLFDPAYPNDIRYVGKTVNESRRFYLHCNPNIRQKTPVVRWLLNLKAKGTQPIFRVLECTSDWELAERKWIAYYRDNGVILLNVEDGGSWSKEFARPKKTGRHLFKEVMCRAGKIAKKVNNKKLSDAIRKLKLIRGQIYHTYGEESVKEFDKDLYFNALHRTPDGEFVFSKEAMKGVVNDTLNVKRYLKNIKRLVNSANWCHG